MVFLNPETLLFFYTEEFGDSLMFQSLAALFAICAISTVIPSKAFISLCDCLLQLRRAGAGLVFVPVLVSDSSRYLSGCVSSVQITG